MAGGKYLKQDDRRSHFGTRANNNKTNKTKNNEVSDDAKQMFQRPTKSGSLSAYYSGDASVLTNDGNSKIINQQDDTFATIDFTGYTQTNNYRENTKLPATGRTIKSNKMAKINHAQKEALMIEAAKRDGTISGLIVLFVMAAFFGCYMLLSAFMPELGPQAVSDKAVYALLYWMTHLMTGGHF
jgi:hypothetical protein